MADIFNEVDEEVRREQLKKLWDRYHLYILTTAILLVLAVAGWRFYQWLEAKKAAEAGAAFQNAMTLSAEGKRAEAEAAFAKIAKEAPAGYRDLARMQAASELAQRDPKAALEAYDAIAADTRLSQTLRDLAAVRGGFIGVDLLSYEDIRQRLEALTEARRPFRNAARELLALSAWRAGDWGAATRWFDMVATDPEAGAGTRRRIETLRALAAAGAKS